jgi:hypothetical protein
LYVTVADATAQKEVEFKVKQTADGKIIVSVNPFLFWGFTVSRAVLFSDASLNIPGTQWNAAAVLWAAVCTGQGGSNGTWTKLLHRAIYTRNSTARSLALEFNSLNAQRDACETYEFVVNKAEAETVRTIFRRYLDLQSFKTLVVDPARCHGWRKRRFQLAYRRSKLRLNPTQAHSELDGTANW